MGFGKILRRFGSDERGAIAIWMALAMTMILGLGALAVDMSELYIVRTQLQSTADAAALAAAKALPDGPSAVVAAQMYAQVNMPSANYGTVVASADVVPGNWDTGNRLFTPAGTPLNAVRVLARRDQQNGNPVATAFANAFGISSVNVAAASIAVQSPGTGCIVMLNSSASKAFYVQGNASVHTTDCDIQVNSCNSTDAMKGQGNTLVEVVSSGLNQIRVCGEVAEVGPTTFTPAPDKNNPDNVVPDPFASLAMPDPTLYAACDFTNFSANGDVTLSPGVYCGGISLAGTGTATFTAAGGTLSDGLFIIKDGPLTVNGNVSVVGDGVTLFMTGASANLNFGGTADIGISAPATGNFAGFAIIGDRDNPATSAHLMRGTAMGGYNGHIYLSNAKVLMQGTATGTLGASDCTTLVADTIELLGTPNFEAANACSDFGGAPAGGIASLVN